MITIKNFRKVESLEEAWELNQKKTNMILGGMIWTKMQKKNIQTAIDLSGLGFDQIEETDDAISIGCMVTLRQMETDSALNQYSNGAVKEALCHIVGVQFRNVATVGGSIWGRYGFSDVLTVLLSMDSYVELYKGGIIPLSTFASMKHDNDVLVRIIIKKEDKKFSYQSVRATKTDFPTITCACGMKAEGEERSFVFAIGARPGRAVRVESELLNITGTITEEMASHLARMVVEQIVIGGNLRGSVEYRKRIARTVVKRALLSMGGEKNVD